MRIIAGEKRSRKLLAPEGNDTRPTGDRVKEALFSILGARVIGARILDLYAGSGAMSLEALSRGAESAVMADQAAKACDVIRKNIEALSYQQQTRLLKMNDKAALALLEKENAAFDLIFLDPPYKMDVSQTVEELILRGLLKEDGLIVAEHARETPPVPVRGACLLDRREYGITGLSFFEAEKKEES